MANCVHSHSRWETGDQIGAAGHYLTPETTLAALKKVKQGLSLIHISEPTRPY